MLTLFKIFGRDSKEVSAEQISNQKIAKCLKDKVLDIRSSHYHI